MRIDNCPKKLNNCHEECPQFPCWVYDEHMEKKSKKSYDGWE